jgi:hypothetical protein
LSWQTLTPALSRQFIVIKITIDYQAGEGEGIFCGFFAPKPGVKKPRAVKTTDLGSLAPQIQDG